MNDFIVKIAKSSDELKNIYQLRYKVYCEEHNYLDPKDYPNKQEKDEFDLFSEHFIVKNKDGKIAATVRLILYSEIGFPIEKYFELHLEGVNFDRQKTAEISRLIVLKEYRESHLIILLIKGMYQYVKRNDILYAYGIMDDRLLRVLSKFGFPLKKIGEYKLYQGKTCPHFLSVKEMEKCLKKKNKLLYKIFRGELE